MYSLYIQDINEHPPIFTQATYNSTIYENHVVGNDIGVTVLANENGDTGLNDPPTYSIISGNVNGAFSVDENTGVFTLAHSLDWETLSPNPISVKVRTYTVCVCMYYACLCVYSIDKSFQFIVACSCLILKNISVY